MRTAHVGAAPAAEGEPLLQTRTPGARDRPPARFSLPALASGPGLKPMGPSRAADGPCGEPERRGPRGSQPPSLSPPRPSCTRGVCLHPGSIPLKSPGNSPFRKVRTHLAAAKGEAKEERPPEKDHGSAGWGYQGP